MAPPGLNWTDYIAGHPERLPRAPGDTWADVAPAEYRRVTRNWRRWQRRRRPSGPLPQREPWEAH